MDMISASETNRGSWRVLNAEPVAGEGRNDGGMVTFHIGKRRAFIPSGLPAPGKGRHRSGARRFGQVAAWRAASARRAAMASPRKRMQATGTGRPASASARMTQVLHVKQRS